MMNLVSPTICVFFLSTLILSGSSASASDQKISRADYIKRYRSDAVRDMKKTGVPASITMAQACLESQDGNSPLAREANNHFGIKCSNWTGETYIQDDDHKDECFRKYGSVLESYDDHSNFLRTRPRYADLFLLDMTDYKGWAHGLKKAGYATNPQYAHQLIRIIEDNNLYELDRNVDLPEENYFPVASAKPQPPLMKSQPSRILVPSTEVINPYEKGHHVFFNNETPYVIARSSDSYRSIADEFGMAEWQILKYNELEKGTPVDEGEKIYLKPKRRTGDRTFCVVKNGQSLHDIAQEYGVKMKLLLKWNELSGNDAVTPGQKILLERKRS